MEAIKFKESNLVLAKDQPEYSPLPVFYGTDDQGEVISCYGLSFRERLVVLFTGRIWLHVWTFKQPLQPQFLQVENPFGPKS